MRVSKDAQKVLDMLHSLERERHMLMKSASINQLTMPDVYERQVARWYVVTEAVERAEAILGRKS